MTTPERPSDIDIIGGMPAQELEQGSLWCGTQAIGYKGCKRSITKNAVLGL